MLTPISVIDNTPVKIKAKPDDPLGFNQRRDNALESILDKQCMCLGMSHI